MSGGERALTYRVGDTGPAGGLIFFVDTYGEFEDFDYLEAAPAFWDASSPSEADPSLPLCTANTARPAELSSSAASALGAGLENTRILLEGDCAAPGTLLGRATGLSIVNDGVVYDDWYLPSLGELTLLMTEFTLRGEPSRLPGGNYASSSFFSTTDFFIWLAGRPRTTANQASAWSARPVRQFSEPTS